MTLHSTTGNRKKEALVLGGTNPHIALIALLQEQGYYVILVDYKSDPPAKAVADEHLQISIFDIDAIMERVANRNIQLAISACVDHANVSAVVLAEKLHLPKPYSYDTALMTSSKYLMKKRMIEHGLPTSRLLSPDDINDKNRNIHFPVVVKPVDCGGSKGVRKVRGYADLDYAIHDARAVSKSDKVIIEEYIDGVELSADCFVVDGTSHILLIREKYLRKNHSNTVLSNYASVAPAGNVNGQIRNKLETAVQNIAASFNLETTPLLVQFLVKDNDIYIIEFAPRVGGGLNFRAVEIMSGVNIIESTYKTFVNEKVTIVPEKRQGYVMCYHFYCQPSIYGSMQNYQELMSENIIDEIYFHKNSGDPIGDTYSSSDRVASIIITGPTMEILENKLHYITEHIDIVDADGNSIMDNEI